MYVLVDSSFAFLVEILSNCRHFVNLQIYSKQRKINFENWHCSKLEQETILVLSVAVQTAVPLLPAPASVQLQHDHSAGFAESRNDADIFVWLSHNNNTVV
jgi:hypothetical protein